MHDSLEVSVDRAHFHTQPNLPWNIDTVLKIGDGRL